MFAAGVISVRGGCNKCSRGNTWNKQPATDQSDYSISLKYGINIYLFLYIPVKPYFKAPTRGYISDIPWYFPDILPCGFHTE